MTTGKEECITLTPTPVGLDPRLELFCELQSGQNECCVGTDACTDITSTGPITICKGACIESYSCNQMNLEEGARIRQSGCVGISSCGLPDRGFKFTKSDRS